MKGASFIAFLVLCLLNFVSVAKAPDSVYQVEITLRDCGQDQPLRKTLFVEPRKEAVLSLLHLSEPIGQQMRITLGAPLVTKNGKSATDLRVQVLDQVGENWVLGASPSLGMELDKEASIRAPISSPDGMNT